MPRARLRGRRSMVGRPRAGNPVEGLEPRVLFTVAGEDPSLIAWYRADSIAAPAGSDVAVWADLTGNGYHATQSNPARQPNLIANAIGRRPAVRFDAGGSTQLSFTRPVSGDFTIMVVFRSTQGVGKGPDWYTGAGLVDGEVGGVTNDFGLTLNAAGQLLGGAGKPDATAVSGVGFNDGRPHVATYTRSAATGTVSLYVDGKLFQQVTGGTQSLTASPRLTIGSLQTNVNYFTGDVADVRVYSTVLPAATRAAVEDGLEAAYGIAPPAARTFTNPVVDVNFPDPGLLKVGNTYYAFATNTGGRNAPVRTSTNLVNWSSPSDALPTLPSWAKSGRTWAPHAARMADGVHYNLYYTAWSKTDNRQHIGVAQATSPAGPYTPVGTVPLVDQASQGGAIDSSVFTDPAGVRYLVWKNDGNAVGQTTYVYAQRLSNDGLSFVGPATALLRNDQAWEGSLIEAPEIVLRNGKYYLFYSANSYTNSNYAIGYAVSKALLGPYTKVPGPWARSMGEVVGPGGQSFTVGPDGNTWMLYHTWENNLGYRAMSADMVQWVGDVPVLRGPSRAAQPVPTFIRAAPALTMARTDAGGSYASGILTGAANTSFTVQFFTPPAAGDSAPVFVGGTQVRTDASGKARFVDVPLSPLARGQALTATATDVGGEGSAASAAVVVGNTGDVNGDGAVDFSDLVRVAQHYNAAALPGEGDVNGDGRVDFGDLVLLAQNYEGGAAAAMSFAAAAAASTPVSSPFASDATVRVSPPAEVLGTTRRIVARGPRPVYS